MQPSDLGNKARSIQASQLPMVLAAGLGVSIVLHVSAIVGIARWWQQPAAPQPDEPIEVTLVDPDPITPTPTKSIPPARPQPKQNRIKKPIDSPGERLRQQLNPIPIKLPATAISKPATAKLKPSLAPTQSPAKPATRSNIAGARTSEPIIAKVKPTPAKPALSPKSIVRSQPLIPPKIAPTPPPFDLPVPTEPKSPPATPQPIVSPKLARPRREKPLATPSSQPPSSTPPPQLNTTPVVTKPSIAPPKFDRPVSPTPVPTDKAADTPQTPKPGSPITVRVSPPVAPTEAIAPKLVNTQVTPTPSSASTSRSIVPSQSLGSLGGTRTDGNRSSGNDRRNSPSPTRTTGNSGSNPTGNPATGKEGQNSAVPTGGTGNGGRDGGSNGNASGEGSGNSPTGNTTTASTGAGKLECIRNCDVPKLKDLQDTDGGKDRLRIRIAIDANGMVTDAQIAKSSGNPQIDTTILEGIKQMQFAPSGKQINGIIRANILIRSARPLLVPAIAYSYEFTQTS